jgi:exopolyphosphatase/guanosine-5'-triphosphate,3'-diphosphate pyrophosphatase
VNFAALDIGTNSVHLVVARPTAGAGFETITREKEVVRLGSGGGDMKVMTPEAIDRGVAALARMRAVADGHDAVLRAVATSATREALNARDFVARAAAEANVDIEVISGLEEARLIHLGVLQAVPVFDRRLLLVDVGGGSTELLLGESGETLAARSFKLGAVRLTDRYFPGGAVTAKAVRSCRDQVRATIEHFRRDVERWGFDVAIASSGTAETAARMVHAARFRGAAWEPLRTYNCFEFTAEELAAIAAELAGHRTAEARVKLPGLDAPRADIIVAGGLILSTIAETFGVECFTFSEAALREGVLVDTMSRFEESQRSGLVVHHLRDVSRRSIQQLVDRCDEDPQHSRHVASLAVALFDQLPDLRRLDELLDVASTRLSDREYLEAGALLANVGLVVAHSKHHVHAYYIIRNSELTGLTDGEIEIIAQIARYHRKSEPKASHPEFAALEPTGQDVVRSLAAVLRVAIGLDRRHDGRVAAVDVADGDTVAVRAIAAGDADVDLEVYAARERTGLLARVLGRPVEVVAG